MKVAILGGGTFSHVRSHLALAAPAFGTTARQLYSMYDEHRGASLYLTKMADHRSGIVTNEDVSALVDQIIADSEVKIVYFNVALCDFDGRVDCVPARKYSQRLKTSDGCRDMRLFPADKIIGRLRAQRKDLFVVGWKTTSDATPDEQYLDALNLLKANSLNLVMANDVVTRWNMIVTPEESRYAEGKDRQRTLTQLKTMVDARSKCTFTRSTVVEGAHVPWNSLLIPDSLRKVVEYCIEKGAYKPFRGSTAGHFAVKIDDQTVLTSKRKHNYNDLKNDGLVMIEYEGRDKVTAFGFKPSVGGQSQRIVFEEHPEMDCIVHFHCPEKFYDGMMPIAEQWKYECGSHQCGENTSRNLAVVDTRGVKCVMLDNHGPNIVFNRNIDPQIVIDFIRDYFDLSAETGGLIAA